jgi:hypothetical protein
MKDFWNRCLSALDQQVIPLESEQAKKCAIQAVQRVLRSMMDGDCGSELILAIVSYPFSLKFPKKEDFFPEEVVEQDVLAAFKEEKALEESPQE